MALLHDLRNHKAVVFTDFDGTITNSDSNDFLTDKFGFGRAHRLLLGIEIINDRLSFREGFKDMLDSVALSKTFQQCTQELVANITLDPGFAPFYAWCRQQNIPVIVLSGGMEPLIRALLEKLLGPDAAREIPIVSNDVRTKPDGVWEIVYRDESHFGHDKSRAIKPYKEEREKLPLDQRPAFFYCGDGVSDLSAARETDLLFAKAGHDLIKYCERENVPFTVFNDFADIHAAVQDVVDGRKTVSSIADNR